MTGPIALVGSGEFLPGMDEIDRYLLAGGPPRVVFLPTAAAPEGRERLEYWVRLGLDHYEKLGVEAEPLLVLDRADAEKPELAERVAGAGLVYLSGGNPAYLTDTLHDSAVWRAIHDAWKSGSALAGCSAGAIALSAVVRERFAPDAPLRPALELIDNLAVLPHFDRLRQFRPELVDARSRNLPEGLTLVGIDEDTAIVGGPLEWTVMGRRRAWVFPAEGDPQPFAAGETLKFRRSSKTKKSSA
ncbi:MAG TPA: Type 1 glutamine amidotransferase-like domain-containing protein [Actinomycetota bacterium]|nr:Type 1 glutamine amidotransferase-like domain-containing protein [Actinomycetota bacterium]